MSSYSEEARHLMEQSPEFFEEILHYLGTEVRRLRQVYEQVKAERKK